MEKNSRPATLQDVARAAGVSKTTASAALSGNGRLSVERRQAILDVARELRFQVNPHAQRLSTGVCHNTVGLFSLGLDTGVVTQKVQTIHNLLTKQGFDVPLYGFGAYQQGGFVEQQKLMRSLCQQRPQAIICNLGGTQVSEALLELSNYQSRGGIVVCYDSHVQMGCDHVIFDREDNSYQAARHLLELGHRAIGFYLNGNVPIQGTRVDGFQRALGEFGGTTREEWMFNGLYEAGGKAMAQKFLAMKHRPTGICVVNDNSAMAFIAEVQNAGVRVPDDVSVVGHDNLPIAPYGQVPLTTMAHPVDTIAFQVAEMASSRLQGRYDGPPRHATVKGGLVIRRSTAPPAASPSKTKVPTRELKCVASPLNFAASPATTRS